MASTKIEWTDAVWNPIRGCTRVSEGCRNCYAERIAARFSKAGQPFEGIAEQKMVLVNPEKFVPEFKYEPRWTGKVIPVIDNLEEPLHWKKPRRVFVNSMSDLFHEKLDWSWIGAIFKVMAQCPQHTFQVLTKRAENMRKFVNACADGKCGCSRIAGWPLPNVWLGVSVEDQATAAERIPLLLQTPSAIRFLSIEPMLGPIDLTKLKTPNREFADEMLCAGGRCKNGRIDWVICGGESGPSARIMEQEWARNLGDQCQMSGVPFFFKQWGEFLPPGQHNIDAAGDRHENFSKAYWRCGKKKAGRLLDGREWNEFPDQEQ